jgi:hypothetical protein
MGTLTDDRDRLLARFSRPGVRARSCTNPRCLGDSIVLVERHETAAAATASIRAVGMHDKQVSRQAWLGVRLLLAAIPDPGQAPAQAFAAFRVHRPLEIALVRSHDDV